MYCTYICTYNTEVQQCPVVSRLFNALHGERPSLKQPPRVRLPKVAVSRQPPQVKPTKKKNVGSRLEIMMKTKNIWLPSQLIKHEAHHNTQYSHKYSYECTRGAGMHACPPFEPLTYNIFLFFVWSVCMQQTAFLSLLHTHTHTQTDYWGRPACFLFFVFSLGSFLVTFFAKQNMAKKTKKERSWPRLLKLQFNEKKYGLRRIIIRRSPSPRWRKTK